MHHKFGITQNRTHGKTWAIGYGLKRKPGFLYEIGTNLGEHNFDLRVLLRNLRRSL